MSAWKLIKHQELASAQSSLVLTSIPQTYTDLKLVFSIRTSLASLHFDDLSLRLNEDSGSNYTIRALRAREGTISGIGQTKDRIESYEACASGSPANTFGSGTAYFSNYTTSGPKSFSVEGFSITNNSGTLVQGGIVSGFWNGNASITSITIFSANGQNLVQYSSATLYGVLKGFSGGVTVS